MLRAFRLLGNLLEHFADRALDRCGRYRFPQRRTGTRCNQIGFLFGVCGEHDDRRRSQRRIRSKPSDGLATRNVAQLQVHEDEVGKSLSRGNHCGDAGIHGVNHKAGALQNGTTQLQRCRVRFDDERAPAQLG